MSSASTLPPPTGPAAPPPVSDPSPPPSAPPVLTARWLGLLGGGLVAVASLIVGLGGRELLGAYGPAAGLGGAATASWFASTRMRTAAPVVAAVLAHLARLVAAIAAAAVVAGSTSWAAVPAAAGIAAGIASIGWRLGGRWAVAALRAVAVGGVAMSIAAETVLPLGPLLAVAGAIAVAGVPTRRGGRFGDVGSLLAALALLAPVGGLPGRWRLGPGTLARLGLRGDVLDWAAPAAAVVAGAAFVVVSGRVRSLLLARLSLVAVAANLAVGLGWDGWEPVRPTTYVALAFAAVQIGLAAATADPFWARVLAPVTPLALIAGWVLALELTIEVVAVTVVDGVDRTLALAPALVAVGFLVGRFDPVGRVPLSTSAIGMALLSVFAATGSAAAVAGAAVAVTGAMALLRPGTEMHVAAAAATVLTFIAQLAHETIVPEALTVVLIALAVVAVGTYAGARNVLPLGAAVTFGAAVDVHWMLEWMIVYAGGTGVLLVAARRANTLAGATLPAVLGFMAIGGLLEAPAATRDVVAASVPVGIALTALASVGLAGWWRGEHWARHLVAAAAVTASGCWAVVAGADVTVCGTAALVGGVAVCGAAFSRRRFGVADVAGLAALTWASAYGFVGDHDATGWAGITALGIAVGLHGLCFVDFTVAGIGGGMALFGAIGLGAELDAAGWVGGVLPDAGVSGTDVTAFLVVAAMAAGGLVVRLTHRSASSWATSGPASATASLYLLVTIALNDAPDTRLLVTLTTAIGLVVAGALSRSAAPLVIGTATVLGAVTMASWTTLRSLPGWAWIGAGGVLLLTIGAIVERRGHADGDESEHHTVRRILTTFR